MKNKQVYLSMLIVAMAMGTAWAIRGQFGHEQGAAWAGGIGSLAVLLVMKRTSWYNRAFGAVLAGSIGWGIGGIMSYGVVVGYGRGTDFGNVYYGLGMLFVIGGLYGFLGGGLFGLALASSLKKRVKWSNIIVELIAGALLIYFFFVMEFEWLMTPPRSELWAACLGMAMALTWYMTRNKQYGALRVAVFAGLGGGFGFAFGNFLQVWGHVLEIPFNFWNVMEYSLGFFGGMGMTYGTLTSAWETDEGKQSKDAQLFPLLMLGVFIPFVVWQQTFDSAKISELYTGLGVVEVAVPALWIAFFLIFGFNGFWLSRYYVGRDKYVNYAYKDLVIFFASYLFLYMIYSYLVTGALVSLHRPEQYLYTVNLLIILVLLPRTSPEVKPIETDYATWTKYFFIVMIILALLALMLANSHGELNGAQKRF